MKQKFLLTFILTGCINAFAQPVIIKQKTIGGASFDRLSCTYLTSDGGVIIGGYSTSKKSGEKSGRGRGGYDFWVVKLDKKSNIEWDKTIGGSGDDLLTSIEQTSDGGYILGGISSSEISGEKTEASRGFGDYWVVKLDAAANIEWDKTIGGIYGDDLGVIKQTVDNGYIIGGGSASGISGEKTEASRGGADFWLVKIDATGQIQWDKTLGGNDADYFFTLEVTTDGGYIAGGGSESNISNEKTENSKGSSDYWMIKTDSSGNRLWDKTIGGGGYDELLSLQQTKEGGYILGGNSSSPVSGDKTSYRRGMTDYWIVKLDSSRNIEWDKTIGGSGYEFLTSIFQTIDSGYVIGGHSDSPASLQKTENGYGEDDYWVVKLTAQGKIQWDKSIGGSNDDALWSIKEIGNNNYLLGGESFSGISGSKTDSSRGLGDYWLVQLKFKPTAPTMALSESISTDLNLKMGKDFTVYPNPANNIINVQSNGAALFSLLNQDGKILISKNINGNNTIDISGIGAGLYYLKNCSTGTVQKIIITK